MPGPIPSAPGLGDPAEWPTYSVSEPVKRRALLGELQRLTAWHASACRPYRDILEKMHHGRPVAVLEDLPFLPVRLFKHEKLVSVAASEVVKTMTSSGTSGHRPSEIFLDARTASLQSKVLSRIVTDVIGPQRLPMLVIDSAAMVADRTRFSARAAGVRGFSVFGRPVEYALDDQMQLDVPLILSFAERHADQDLLVFGFTSIVWQHLVTALEASGQRLPLARGVLIHGGGWKRMEAQAVDGAHFAARLDAVTGLKRVHNYYGMVEQAGSVFMECARGRLHTSTWSEIIIRDPLDFVPLPLGQRGLIQLLSVLPHSYPGHSILSEDEGEIVGVDDCPCGRMGTTFRVFGRVQDAEIRGCSDTWSPAHTG